MNFLSSQTTSLLLDAPTRTQTRPEKVPAELKNFSQEWFRFRSFGGESYYIQNHSQRVIADPRCLCPVPLTKVFSRLTRLLQLRCSIYHPCFVLYFPSLAKNIVSFIALPRIEFFCSLHQCRPISYTLPTVVLYVVHLFSYLRRLNILHLI